MQIKSKLLLILLIGLAASLAVSMYLWQQGGQKPVPGRTEEQAQTELEHAKDSQAQAEKTPFIDDLPIRTMNYEILYNSLKNKIVIIFPHRLGSLENAKSSYQTEVNAELAKIGVDVTQVTLDWQIE